MLPLGFTFMAACPPDPEGAAIFAEAIKGYPLKVIAAECGVNQSLVTRWLAVGNVPEARIDRLPDDCRRRYAELQARRRGAVVVERDMVRDIIAFLYSLRPSAVKATLGPAECGSLTGRQDKRIA